MGKRTLYSLESDIRRILEGNDFISTSDEGGKQWYMNLVTDLAIFIQQELEKAREEKIQNIFTFEELVEIERWYWELTTFQRTSFGEEVKEKLSKLLKV